ncbi:hypothetical protein [Streptomyces sp. NPDC097981]|uniref:hypothetical protein n=1 Tax=Streptomyces sp. NPDC097981 TaxID=3155428 RepID=UPI0033231A9E
MGQLSSGSHAPTVRRSRTDTTGSVQGLPEQLLAGRFHHLLDRLFTNTAAAPALGTDTRVVRVDGSGHYLPEERPEVVVEELTRFLG